MNVLQSQLSWRKKIGEQGRLIRPSGTEPLSDHGEGEKHFFRKSPEPGSGCGEGIEKSS